MAFKAMVRATMAHLCAGSAPSPALTEPPTQLSMRRWPHRPRRHNSVCSDKVPNAVVDVAMTYPFQLFTDNAPSPAQAEPPTRWSMRRWRRDRQGAPPRQGAPRPCIGHPRCLRMAVAKQERCDRPLQALAWEHHMVAACDRPTIAAQWRSPMPPHAATRPPLQGAPTLRAQGTLPCKAADKPLALLRPAARPKGLPALARAPSAFHSPTHPHHHTRQRGHRCVAHHLVCAVTSTRGLSLERESIVFAKTCSKVLPRPRRCSPPQRHPDESSEIRPTSSSNVPTNKACISAGRSYTLKPPNRLIGPNLGRSGRLRPIDGLVWIRSGDTWL